MIDNYLEQKSQKLKVVIAAVVILGIGAALFIYFGDINKADEATEPAINGSEGVTSTTVTEEKPQAESPPTSTTGLSSDSGPSAGEDTGTAPETESAPTEDRQLTWVTSVLHGAGGRFGSIAIDNNDKVHIAHFGYDQSAYSNQESVLYHTTNAGETWLNEIVERVGVADGISMAIDSNGGIHISYQATDGLYGLKYAYRAGNSSAWVISSIDTTGTVWQYSSLAVDSKNNRVHIVYGNEDNGSLKYATNTIGESDNWVTETIENDISGQVHSSIAVDADGRCYIAYRAQTSTLRFVSGSLNSWSTPTTLDSGGVISGISIALDGSNNVHISYHLGGLTAIKYATDSGGAWAVQQLADSDSDTQGKHTSITVDSSDNIYISYYKESSTNAALKIIQNIDGIWSDHTIDEDGDKDGTGKYSSISLDSENRIHISYYRENGSELRYAVQQ
jgi:hypothetical protein